MSDAATLPAIGARPSASLPAPDETGSIEARRFNFYYDQKQALFDLDLTIPRRSVTAFIGPSGCGKSTFLRSINRMNETIPGTRKTGNILLDGEDIYDELSDVVTLHLKQEKAYQDLLELSAKEKDQATERDKLLRRQSELRAP